jgi:hypothetical protein
MIESTATSGWEVAFTATFPGIYVFVEHGGERQEYELYDGQQTTSIDDVWADQFSFTVYMDSGYQLLRRGGASKLSGVRLGDEL